MQHGTIPPAAAGSDLVRMLAALSHCPVPDVRATLSDTLGQWLGWKGALQLSAALSAGPSPAAAAPARPASATASGHALPSRRAGAPLRALSSSLAGRWQEQRSQLEQAIDALPAPTLADAQAFSPYRFQVQLVQKTLLDSSGQWRERLRLALRGHSPASASLATLDAVMERALAERDRGLSAEVLRCLQQQVQQGAVEARGLALVRGLLHAELQHRELPLQGLLAALQTEHGTHTVTHAHADARVDTAAASPSAAPLTAPAPHRSDALTNP
jgi:hypothetical protein